MKRNRINAFKVKEIADNIKKTVRFAHEHPTIIYLMPKLVPKVDTVLIIPNL